MSGCLAIHDPSSHIESSGEGVEKVLPEVVDVAHPEWGSFGSDMLAQLCNRIKSIQAVERM